MSRMRPTRAATAPARINFGLITAAPATPTASSSPRVHRRSGRVSPARDYVARALLEGPFRRVRHPGNLTYVWPSVTAPRRIPAGFPPGLPYRKAFNTLVVAPRLESSGGARPGSETAA